jgi:4-hydroxybenzoate polyprenyltransferase
MSDAAPFTDIPSDGWIDRRMPEWSRPYLRLARFDRPTGIWLLLLPCWWAIALGSAGSAQGLGLAVLFGIGAVVMRGAGCTLNDILDRDLDAQVERTRNRPLPSGEIGLFGAILFLAFQLAIGLVILIQLNRLSIALGVLSLALVASYPLMKRITWWPQAFLGLTFNWGALMGWTAATGRIGWSSIVLYAAGFFWTLVYDTIYAHQDARDDATAGIKSTARRLGRFSKPWLFLFALLTVALLLLAGQSAGLGMAYGIMLIPVMLHLVWLLALWNPADPRDCLRRFQAGRWTGLLVLLAIAFGRIFAPGAP